MPRGRRASQRCTFQKHAELKPSLKSSAANFVLKGSGGGRPAICLTEGDALVAAAGASDTRTNVTGRQRDDGVKIKGSVSFSDSAAVDQRTHCVFTVQVVHWPLGGRVFSLLQNELVQCCYLKSLQEHFLHVDRHLLT